MKGIRFSAAAFAVACIAIACSKTDGSSTQTSGAPGGEVPMPGTQHISIALISNYAFMGQMASKGDGRSFSDFYVDSAAIARGTYPPLAGKLAIRDFIRNADEWGILEWTRMSEGFRVEGREVVDSGTYALTLAQPLPPNTLDIAGRYRTRWVFTTAGAWLIQSDTLISPSGK